MDLKQHWEKIYNTKDISTASWYQPKPETSLNLIESFKVDKSAKIIDVGGGDGFLVDCLLDLGYNNITVLDISRVALEKAQDRLGERASLVTWIESDVTQLPGTEKYDVWHDRAAFHFLNKPEQIDAYLNVVNQSISKEGFMSIGTFSETGPDKCSGINITKYSEDALNKLMSENFTPIKCFKENHTTPSGSVQNFQFCAYKKA